VSFAHKQLIGHLSDDQLKSKLLSIHLTNIQEPGALHEIHAHLHQLLHEQSAEAYQYLYALIVSDKDTLSQATQNIVLEHLIQYQERQIRYNKESLDDLIELYKFGVSQDTFHHNGVIGSQRVLIIIHLFSYKGYFTAARDHLVPYQDIY